MNYSNALLIAGIVTLLIFLVILEGFFFKILALVLLLILAVILFLKQDKEKRTISEGVEEQVPDDSLNKSNSNFSQIPFAEPEPEQSADVNLDQVDEGFKIIHNPSRVLTENNIHNIGNKLNTGTNDSDLGVEKFKNLSTEEFPLNVGANQQLSFLLERILIIVRELFSAHTAIYFWYDKRKSNLTIEKHSSLSHEIEKRKIEFQDDILGQIITKQEPEILTDIPSVSERENFRYYTQPQKIKSFLGVPVFHNSTLIGILAIDSKSPDAFGLEQMYMLGRFVRLITVLIDLFAHKHAESIAQRRAESFADFLSQNIAIDNEESLRQSITILSNSLLESDCFSFITYSSDKKNYQVASVSNSKGFSYIRAGDVIEKENTIAGKCLYSGNQVRIGDMAATPLKRFFEDEGIILDGSFLAMPIIYNSEVLGALCYENLKKNTFTQRDLDYLKKVTGMLGILIHSFAAIKQLKELITFDPDTKFYSGPFFMRRIAEELEKAKILNLRSNIVMIKIDEGKNRQELTDPYFIKVIMQQFSAVLEQELDPLSFCGRIEDLAFGVFFLHTDEEDLVLRADKIRIKIARTPISIGTKSTTFTASIGLLNSSDKLDVQALLADLKMAVKKASDTGGNKVLQL